MNPKTWWRTPIWVAAMLAMVSCSALQHPPVPARPEVGAMALPATSPVPVPGHWRPP